jgi:phage gp45-like
MQIKQKLIELGYTISQDTNLTFTATKIDFNNVNELVIKIRGNIIIECYIFSVTRCFRRKKQLDNLQQAFNILQHDLGELKPYEYK